MSSDKHTTPTENPSNSNPSSSHDNDGESIVEMIIREPVLHQVFAIPELLELILCQLDFKDVLNAEQVQKSWKELIESSGPLKRILFREPTGISKDEDNPLFIAASDASTKVLTVGVSEPEIPILATVDALIQEFLQKVTEENLDMNARVEAYLSLLRDAGRRSHWYRTERPEEGWGPAVEDIHCGMCQGFHEKLNPEKLHPVLKFLGKRPVCTKGKYQKIYCRILFVELPRHGQMEWKNYMQQFLDFAKALEKACKEMKENSKLGSLIASRPAITDLALHVFLGFGNRNFRIITKKKPGGLTVKDFLDMFVYAFRHELEYKVAYLRVISGDPGLEGMDEVCEEFDKIHADIKELMKDIPAWESNEYTEEE